ncbi:MAG: hypothetical protein B7Y35_15730 [Sphingomonadales bacterium 28-64-96]|nr:MAG: hypothetical protein B7Y35_15730 [Sphingomonadales bacterium 28-64-96]
MPVALTRRQALAVELRQVLERENGAAGAKVDGPAKAEEVLHGARLCRRHRLFPPAQNHQAEAAKVLHGERGRPQEHLRHDRVSRAPKLR